MRVWLPDNIGVPFTQQISPEIIRTTWTESDGTGPPPWVSWDSNFRVYHVHARETAVRKFAHLARKDFNMLKVHLFASIDVP